VEYPVVACCELDWVVLVSVLDLSWDVQVELQGVGVNLLDELQTLVNLMGMTSAAMLAEALNVGSAFRQGFLLYLWGDQDEIKVAEVDWWADGSSPKLE
jgi:hypothetical protein